MTSRKSGPTLFHGGALIWTVASALLGCDGNKTQDFAPSVGDSVHPVTILQSAKLDSIETDVPGPGGKPARALCASCHDVIDEGEVVKHPEDLKEFHIGLSFSHGALECANCHEPGEPLLLRLSTGERVPVTDAMKLCSQCHGPQRKSYDHGAHGGMTGYWDLSRGPRVRNNCVDCHDAHAPQIPQVVPAKKPVDRGRSPAPHGGLNHSVSSQENHQ